jgi:hypothetical protein
VIRARQRPHDIIPKDVAPAQRGEVSGGVIRGSPSQLTRRDPGPLLDDNVPPGDLDDTTLRSRHPQEPAMAREPQILTAEELAVYEMVATDPAVTPDNLTRATGLDRQTVEAAIGRLRDLGVVTGGRSRITVGPNDWDASP